MQKTKIELDSLEQIVCVMNFTSSASCLLSSLFDNHPNVLIFPDNVIQDFEDFWQSNRGLQLNTMLDVFVDKYSVIFDARSLPKGYTGNAETGEARGYTRMGPKRNEFLYVDVAKFRENMQYFLTDTFPLTRKLFFKAMHLSYSRALGREIINPIIVFGLHAAIPEFRLRALMEDFSNVKFLYMVRNPSNATGSRIRRQVNNGISLSHFKKIIFGVARGGAISKLTPVGSWRAIRMEDLHSSPKQVMKKICEWIDLSWSETLLKSTINGKQWWNENGSIEVSGFRPVPTENFKDYLSKFDRARLEILLGRKFLAWNYEVSILSQNLIIRLLLSPLLIIPFKIELMTWTSLITNNWDTEKNYLVSFIMILKIIFIGYALGRLGLLRSWFVLIRGYQIEAPLLKLNKN